MIEWKGLYANTPYSSANNKAQDDAVVGMQDTIYVTGPGYGGYSANVRVHNASGAVVALIPVSGGGGALSAPAPVRILDDSTTYSYSLEVVRGVVPSDDADKIVIRIVGGASKRYPGQGSTLPDGSTSFAEPVRAPGLQLTASSQRAEADLSAPFRAQALLAIGSSTTEHCSKTTGIMAGTAGFFELDDGPLAWGKSRYGLPLDLVYNGAVGGTSSEQIFASRVAMLAAGAAHPGAWCWLQFGATDMQNGSITAQACFDNYALPATQDCRAAGHRVALIIPHMTITATPARIANVVEYERLCCELADRDPANIAVISLFRHVSAPFGGYSPALLVDPTNGVHLTVEGAMAAAPAFAPFARFMPAPEIFSPGLFGTPINTDPNCLATASLALTNGTSALAPRSMDGRAGVDVTAIAAGFVFCRVDCAMPLNQSFRVIADMEVLADGVISMVAQARGVNSGDIHAMIGGAVWNTSEVDYVGNLPVGTRRRLVTSRFTAATTPASRIYARFSAAGAGAKVRLRSLGVVRVDA